MLITEICVLRRFENFVVVEFYVYLGGDSFLKRVAKFGEIRNSSDLLQFKK